MKWDPRSGSKLNLLDLFHLNPKQAEAELKCSAWKDFRIQIRLK